MDIEKLDIKDGDILIVKNYESRDSVYKLADNLRELGRKNVMIIHGMDIRILTEEEMERYGWKRKVSRRNAGEDKKSD